MKPFLLTTILCLSMTISSFAQQSGKIGDLSITWNLDAEGTLTISGEGSLSDYFLYNHDGYTPWYDYRSSIKSVIISEGITTIGEWNFAGCVNLVSITIPNGVTRIENGAFYGCNNLVSITIPNSVNSIGDRAFQNCSSITSIIIPEGVTMIEKLAFRGCKALNSIILPNSVTSIGDGAFGSCFSLNSVTIPNNVTFIGIDAFYGCNITSITIPASVTVIRGNAFRGCIYLTSIEVSPQNRNYKSESGVLFNKAMTTLVTYPAGKKGEYTIPNSVINIGEWALVHCEGLTSITIPNSVTSIEPSAFSFCDSLTSITIPSSVTSIGDYAFSPCRGLTSITISEGVISIGDRAFSNTGLTSITIPSSVTNIGRDIFHFSPVKHIYVGWTIPPVINDDVFGEHVSSCILHVPAGSKKAYEKATVWKDFTIKGDIKKRK